MPSSAMHTHHAFTLIETLAVVVLVSLVASAALWSLAGIDDLVRVHEVAAMLRDADARARLWARGGRAVELRLEASSITIASAAETLARIELPGSIELLLVDPVAVADAPFSCARVIWIDRVGRSRDYLALIRGPNSSIAVQIVGLTGDARRLDSRFPMEVPR